MTKTNETLDQMRIRFRKEREIDFKRNRQENIYLADCRGYDKY